MLKALHALCWTKSGVHTEHVQSIIQLNADFKPCVKGYGDLKWEKATIHQAECILKTFPDQRSRLNDMIVSLSQIKGLEFLNEDI